MNINAMFPRKYAVGMDLKGPVTLAISHIEKEKMTPPGGKPTEKFVIYFIGANRGVVLSRTLAEQIAEATGSQDTDVWTGKKITLYPETVLVCGLDRVAIRARRPEPERIRVDAAQIKTPVDA